MDCHGGATRFQKLRVYMAGTSLQTVKNVSVGRLVEIMLLWNEMNILNAGDGLPIMNYQWLSPVIVSAPLETPQAMALPVHGSLTMLCPHIQIFANISPTYSHMLRNKYSHVRSLGVCWLVYQWLRQTDECKTFFCICSLMPNNAEIHIPLSHIYLHTTVSRSVHYVEVTWETGICWYMSVITGRGLSVMETVSI
jgi:hypothetical protein